MASTRRRLPERHGGGGGNLADHSTGHRSPVTDLLYRQASYFPGWPNSSVTLRPRLPRLWLGVPGGTCCSERRE